MSNFSDRLKLLRNEKQLTGSEFGKFFNVTKSAVSNWEINNREPSQEMLKMIADFFNVSLDYLMGKSNIRNNEQLQNDNEVKSFTIKLVQELLKSNIISDPNNIPVEITDMIIAALKNDIKQQKSTK